MDQQQLPDFVSRFLSGLNGPGQQGSPMGNAPSRGSYVPPAAAQAATQPVAAAQQTQQANVPATTSSLPNVYGPLAANWSSCPSGFDCCGAAVYADPYSNYECCGEGSFDRRYQKCELGSIIPLTPQGPIGSASARLARLNCGGYLYVAAESYRCCNFDVYDPTQQQCVDGNVSFNCIENNDSNFYYY